MLELALKIPLVALIFASVPLAIIDIRQHRLPNLYTYPLAVLALIGTLIASFISGDWIRFLTALAINLLIAGVGVLLWILKGFGLGDVKLLLSMVQILGYFSPWLVPAVLAIALISAAVVGSLCVLFGALKWKDRIAFGPFLILGYAVCSVPLIAGPTPY